MSPLGDFKETDLDKEAFLQSQTNPYIRKQNFQSSLPSLPPPPSLKFGRQKYDNKKEGEQKKNGKRFLENTKADVETHVENATIKYPLSNTENLIDYYRQTTDSLRELS